MQKSLRGRMQIFVRAMRTWRGAAFLAAVLLSLYVGYSQSGASLEQVLQTQRDTLSTRPASGDIHIVEIDAQSLQKLAEWPWPRSYHARLVDKLHRAGAAQIAFDVDFSAVSRAGGDRAFADALRRADGAVILPTHLQARNSGSDRTDAGQFVESLPLGIFARHAFLASVNVKPDASGQLNNYLYGTVTDNIARPSLASMLGGRAGNVDQSFRIDQSIDPATIPRHSFADILDGSADMSALRAKHIVIGATAIEMGDRYATARYGILPGVVIQAMAAETLYQNRALSSIGPWPMLLFAVLVTMLRFAYLQSRLLAARLATAGQIVAVLGAPYLFELLGWFTLAVVPALVFLTLAYAGHKLLDFAAALTKARMVHKESGLANLSAMVRDRSMGKKVVAAVMRIDNFSDISTLLDVDERGELLRMLADRLSLISAGSTVYSVDNNALGWIVPYGDMEIVPERFDAAAAILRGKIQISRRSVAVKASFGAASGVFTDIQALVGKAQIAADCAARLGERWSWHSDSITDAAEEKLAVLIDLERALADQEMFPVYQPKYSVRADKVTGAEALIRWNHPEKGLIRPDQFIPVLEKEGRIDELTLYMVRRVIADLARWNGNGPPLNIAINVSALLLSDSDFVQSALEMIGSGQIDARQITIEVTESAALDSPDAAIATLERFKALGTRISIDDYGTGQSTLSYLQRFPADEIKIDQAFVKSMEHVEADRIMVRSTIELAHALNFKVVAEGVEDASCLELLRAYDCDTIQGWHIGKPLPAAEFEATWVEGYSPPLRSNGSR